MKNAKNLTLAQRKILERHGINDTSIYKYLKTVTRKEKDNTGWTSYRYMVFLNINTGITESYTIL